MSGNSYYQQQQAPQHQQQQPSAPPNRSDDSSFLPTGSERAEQMETLQSYEASKPQDEDDKNQEILQQEFPKIDGSLIAAIYGDSKDISATREMLHELSSSEQGQ
ncbi:hypothetical protein K491DRAFT_710353 [Lophiostoma macrostomum CBS 122681]|uniref:CUE domain-containing protein n=1 Tax=Lophiostoma macrostomum CBS 122681 TaxID=1314788 RepID=A0A6A6TSP9_9PLEO|nr:hypothetical protein K491DRAFT_710353 [Lophiostoma macrostomum CBS 122681]